MAKTTTALISVYRVWDIENSTWQAYFFKTSADVVAESTSRIWFTPTLQSKLNGISSGAQVNVIEQVKVNNTALTVSSKSVNIDLSNYLTAITKSMVESVLTGTITSHTHNYGSASDVATLQSKVSAIETVINAAGAEDEGTVIDKLNEVFAFLQNTSEGSNLVTMLSGKVDKTTKVNGKALSSDVTLQGTDIIVGGFSSYGSSAISNAIKGLEDNKVDKTRKINNKALSSDIVLSGEDIIINSSGSGNTLKNNINNNNSLIHTLKQRKAHIWVGATEPTPAPDNYNSFDEPHPNDVWLDTSGT